MESNNVSPTQSISNHFLFYCPLNDEARQLLFRKVQDVKPELFWTEDEAKLECFFREEVFSVANFIKSALKLRKNKLFGCISFEMYNHLGEFCLYSADFVCWL